MQKVRQQLHVVTFFQQDNSQFHTLALSKKWFDQHAIPVLDWPAYSPDLNHIENLWGIISRKVYEAGKHFLTITKLQSAIAREWEAIPESILKNLVNSMPNRIAQVIL